MKTGMELHQKNGGIGTLALWEVEDPTRFGIVGLDEDSRNSIQRKTEVE